MQQKRNWLGLSALLVLGILIGSLASPSSGQNPVRVDTSKSVVVYTDRNAQELSDIVLRLQQAKPVTDEQLQDIYARIEGRAHAGDLSSALIVFRIAEAQRKTK